ncbi:DUF4397 domain-containing protein [Granulicella cerasi]|uniref:DUF4397 domain-containing protein n=1 Tax=Granulicella cerasi TaxID=741063 RepID=A0ABW1ZAX3_9BACT|nr:DUF4397 domain-containing protein [Granulicella cerasi]
MPVFDVLTFRKCALRLAAAAVAAVGLSGCQSVQGTSSTTAGIRFVAASPDAPGLDFLLNKNVQTYNLGYNSYTPNYLYVSPGTYTVAAAQYGADTTSLASTSLTIQTAKHYTAIAANVQASMQLIALTDQYGPAPSGQFSIRLVDLSTATGALDIYLIPTGSTIVTTNPLYTGLTFSGTTGYITVPAGTYQLEIVANGTVVTTTTVTYYTGSQTTFASGAVRTILIDDNKLVTNPVLQAITLADYN